MPFPNSYTINYKYIAETFVAEAVIDAPFVSSVTSKDLTAECIRRAVQSNPKIFPDLEEAMAAMAQPLSIQIGKAMSRAGRKRSMTNGKAIFRGVAVAPIASPA